MIMYTCISSINITNHFYTGIRIELSIPFMLIAFAVCFIRTAMIDNKTFTVHNGIAEWSVPSIFLL